MNAYKALLSRPRARFHERLVRSPRNGWRRRGQQR